MTSFKPEDVERFGGVGQVHTRPRETARGETVTRTYLNNGGGRSTRSGSLHVDSEADDAAPGHHGHESRASTENIRSSVDLAHRRTTFRTDPERDPVLDLAEPGDWLVHHHRDGIIQLLTMPRERRRWRLFDWVFGIENTRFRAVEVPERLRVSFAEMQRMRLRKLQIKLVKHAVEMKNSGREPDDWETDLAEYIQANKDHDYMVECGQRSRDVFLATTQRSIDRFVIQRVVEVKFWERWFNDESKAFPAGEPWEPDDGSESIPGTRTNVANQSFWNRVKMATVGGVFLIGPMWLMVLAHDWRYTGLITTTVFVTVFGLSMSAALDKPMDVLSSTAAYAAVLVVFVGVNTD